MDLNYLLPTFNIANNFWEPIQAAGENSTKIELYLPKVVVISDLRSRNEFKLFPSNIWIFKFFILIVFAIKMLLDKPYRLLNPLEFKYDHFRSLFQAESQYQNSNVGLK